MNMDEREKLLDALDFLKEICKGNTACYDCPLGDDRDDCILTQTEPYNWDIKTSPDYEVWRAFND